MDSVEVLGDQGERDMKEFVSSVGFDFFNGYNDPLIRTKMREILGHLHGTLRLVVMVNLVM